MNILLSIVATGAIGQSSTALFAAVGTDLMVVLAFIIFLLVPFLGKKKKLP